MTEPSEFCDVMADNYIAMTKRVARGGVPYATEDIRAMVISCHISAERRGWTPPNGSTEGVATPQDDVPVEGTETPPKDNGYGDYRSKTQVASDKSMNYMKVVMKDAAAKVAKEEKVGHSDAVVHVKKNIIKIYEEYWGHTPNLTSPKGRLNQGQVSMVIDYVKTEWRLG